MSTTKKHQIDEINQLSTSDKRRRTRSKNIGIRSIECLLETIASTFVDIDSQSSNTENNDETNVNLYLETPNKLIQKRKDKLLDYEFAKSNIEKRNENVTSGCEGPIHWRISRRFKRNWNQKSMKERCEYQGYVFSENDTK